MSPAPAYDLFAVPPGAVLAVARGGALTDLYLYASQETARADCRQSFPEAIEDSAAPPLPETRRQLAEYFAGERRVFDLPLAPEGTEFQRRVWQHLLTIPFGATESYRDVALALGQPTATRAVGAANGRNPISIIVPCHRVIGADGSLTGYGGGLPAKKFLLELEGARTRDLFDASF